MPFIESSKHGAWARKPWGSEDVWWISLSGKRSLIERSNFGSTKRNGGCTDASRLDIRSYQPHSRLKMASGKFLLQGTALLSCLALLSVHFCKLKPCDWFSSLIAEHQLPGGPPGGFMLASCCPLPILYHADPHAYDLLFQESNASSL